MLISETHFTGRSYFNIPKYSTYFTNDSDNTAHGVTAILIKKTINHYELPKYKSNHLQATVIQVKMTQYELTVAAVYCPPKYNIKKENFKDFFQTLGQKFVAGGDYNSKHTFWGSRLITTKGRKLTKLIQEQKYSYLSTGTPTYWSTHSNKTPDLLNLFAINGISSEYIEVELCYDLSSDHSPVISTVCSYAIHKTPRSKLHNQKSNWEECRIKLQEEINLNVRLKSPMEIDCTLISLIKIIKQATQDATPTLKISLQNKTRNLSIEIKKKTHS
jgi:hypothetical protein